jgi:hypothetical protein
MRIHYDAISDLRRLAAYDLLESNNLADQYVLALLDEAQVRALSAGGRRITPAPAVLAQPAAADLFAGGYHTVDELYARLAALDAAHPGLVELLPYGRSACLRAGGCTFPGGETLPGYALQAVRLTNEATPGTSQLGPLIVRGTKPVFFLMANIHAREISTPELALRWIESLLDGYGRDADATWLLDEQELWVVPTANPDGHWIVEQGDMGVFADGRWLHRKNAEQDTDGDGRADCEIWPSESWGQFGVDLNRNHSVGWAPSAYVGGLCSLTYSGPAPASAPEVAALQSLLHALIPDQRGPHMTDAAPPDTRGIFITLHSYSELVLRPWSHVSLPAPNEAGLKAIGDKLADFNGYRSCQPGHCLYEAAGTSDDYAYGELGIPAYTFEIGRSFTPSYNEIDGEQWPLNQPALRYAARIARAPYLDALGPDAQDVEVRFLDDPQLPPTLNEKSGLLQLTAVLDSRATGGAALQTAVYSIDQPFWSAAAAPQPMQPADGAFDSPRETAHAALDTASLSAGLHLVYVRGQDAAGRWGAVSAAFVAGTAVAHAYLPLIH